MLNEAPLHPQHLFAMLASLLLLGCQSISAPPDEVHVDPDRKVGELRALWEVAPEHIDACTCEEARRQIPSRAAIRSQAEVLLFRHPRHVPTLLFTAVLAYEAGEPHEAEKRLDDLLALQPSHPEAAVLRARIALEDGNEAFASRLLADQIRMRPDHAGLREAHAAAQYVAGDLVAARAALDAAAERGAPSWRVAYHRGVLAEEDGDVGAARAHYKTALAGQPEWALPRQRLEGLGFQAPVPVAAQEPEATGPSSARPSSPPPPPFPR